MFDHCVIHVSNWERANPFYRDVLGAELVDRGRGACGTCSTSEPLRPGARQHVACPCPDVRHRATRDRRAPLSARDRDLGLMYIVHLMVNDPFRAIASPVRRRIVERLASGPATVGEATSGLGVTKPAITKHLRVLEEAGLVTRVIDGRTHRLTLNAQALDETSEWIGLVGGRRGGGVDAWGEHFQAAGGGR